MIKQSIIIATRESQLAHWQANWVKTSLENIYPGLIVNFLGITTKADKMPYISLAEMGGKGLFVKELEEALLDGRADVAVHCVKDMPVDLPPDLHMPVVLVSDDPWDVLISNRYSSLNEMPPGAVVGTSSLRRQSLTLHARPDLVTRGLRGNVITRLTRLDNGEYDAIILAAAGLNRLGLAARARQVFNKNEFLPAPGQGVLGLECRINDPKTNKLIAPLQDTFSFIRVSAERAMCKRLGGGCHVPIASFAENEHGELVLRGLVASLDGVTVLRAEARGVNENPEILGINVAKELLALGAKEILQDVAKKLADENDHKK
jgi:hydroxymethylbilane synthase